MHRKPNLWTSLIALIGRAALLAAEPSVRGKKEPTADELRQKGLRALRDGEDLFTEGKTNRILMMGALRAATQCLDCHHGQRGDLLGVFSYELRRNPPIRAESER